MNFRKIKQEEESSYLEIRRPLGEKILSFMEDVHYKTKKRINSYQSVYAWDNWSIFDINNKEYFAMHDYLFGHILYDDILERASNAYPKHFNTSNPEDVLTAINLTRGRKIVDMGEWLRQTSYIAVTDMSMKKVLKIGLFRNIDKIEFSSGFLHCLKHFKGRNNQYLTSITNSKKKFYNQPELPSTLILCITDCLFNGAPKSIIPFNDDYTYVYDYVMGGKTFEVHFYYSTKFDVYMFSTIHRI
ncbi:hypothetical protein ACWA1C_08290 [Flectobacillus roseus]